MNNAYKHRWTAVLLLGCTTLGAQWAMGQATTTPQHTDTPPQGATTRRPGTDPLYLQLFGGLNKSANEHLPWTEFSSHPFAGGAFMALGKELTPLWGWRAALRYNHNKSRNVEPCESNDTWGWNSIELFADATFDMSDALRHSTAARRQHTFNMKAFAGIGAAYAFGFSHVPLSYTAPYSRDSRLVPALRAGLTATIQLAPAWRVGMELSQTAFTDRFNGVKAGCPLDTRTNLSIGLSYLIGSARHKRPTPLAPVVYARRLTTVPALPFVTPSNEDVKRRTLTGRAFLDFPVNETTIYPAYRRNPQEIGRICATIDSALFDHTMQVTSISLHGYASPESSYSNNTRLAKGRTAALKDYLGRRYNIEAPLFHTSYTPEDWDNLRGFIADANRRRTKGDIWYENASILETPEAPAEVLGHRDELLRIIDTDTDPDVKEELLKQVGDGKPYRWLLKHVYPGLRHTDYIIEYIVRHYPVQQSRRLIYTHPEALSLNEMYAVANSYEEGTDGWFDALTIAARLYPDDPTANLNAACACVKAKRLKDAKRFLSHAGHTPEALYLADIIKAMEGKATWTMENGRVTILNEQAH